MDLDLNKFDQEMTVLFELADIHGNDDTYCKEVINQCKKLCEIFEYEFKNEKMNTDYGYCHLTFRVSFFKHPVFYTDDLAILKAFAQKFQLTLANGSIQYIEKLL